MSLVRSGGWLRVGVAAALAAGFGTPMLWALGVFGDGDPALQRAMIFMFAGVWFGLSVSYSIGWALRGFLVRHKEASHDDEDAHRRPAPPPPPAAAPPRKAAGK
jgi:hypothetical protein